MKKKKNLFNHNQTNQACLLLLYLFVSFLKQNYFFFQDDNDDDEEKDMEFLEQATPQVQAAATNAFRIVTPDRILDVGAPDGNENIGKCKI